MASPRSTTRGDRATTTSWCAWQHAQGLELQHLWWQPGGNRTGTELGAHAVRQVCQRVISAQHGAARQAPPGLQGLLALQISSHGQADRALVQMPACAGHGHAGAQPVGRVELPGAGDVAGDGVVYCSGGSVDTQGAARQGVSAGCMQGGSFGEEGGRGEGGRVMQHGKGLRAHSPPVGAIALHASLPRERVICSRQRQCWADSMGLVQRTRRAAGRKALAATGERGAVLREGLDGGWQAVQGGLRGIRGAAQSVIYQRGFAVQGGAHSRMAHAHPCCTHQGTAYASAHPCTFACMQARMLLRAPTTCTLPAIPGAPQLCARRREA